jgi:hypothetical protein
VSKTSADNLICEFNRHPLGRKLCCKPAVNEIVAKETGKRVGLRCKEHTANLKNSALFRSVALSPSSQE